MDQTTSRLPRRRRDRLTYISVQAQPTTKLDQVPHRMHFCHTRNMCPFDRPGPSRQRQAQWQRPRRSTPNFSTLHRHTRRTRPRGIAKSTIHHRQRTWHGPCQRGYLQWNTRHERHPVQIQFIPFRYWVQIRRASSRRLVPVTSHESSL